MADGTSDDFVDASDFDRGRDTALCADCAVGLLCIYYDSVFDTELFVMTLY